ncbi:tail fiber protein [Sphingobacterium sp. KU25419]|nr:tail fiber protein [Sphingobacterium sp. KU25419]
MYKKILFLAVFLCCINTLSAQNLVNLSGWVTGADPIVGFRNVGDLSENSREWGIGPHGTQVVLWKSKPSGNGGSDGGFDAEDINIDHQKMYRFTVWIKKTNSHGGATYIGCGHVNHLSNLPNSNPYFWAGDLPELDKWYLVVGYVHGSNDPSTESFGGIYDGITGQRVIAMTDFKFRSNHSFAMIRSFLYDDSNTADRQYIYGPRIEEVNGNEPTIASLLNITTNQADAYFAGKVGIKTKIPGEYDLAVNGKIRSHEIKVESSAATWPDYVFKKEYDLKKLETIEAFIAENGHLPDVPKALDIESNGVELGEMNKVLLKKIEELTLYIIQEKKSNAEQLLELKKEIQTLKKAIK